ncbi:unnamed protein product, partial [Cladocopium goreaui]
MPKGIVFELCLLNTDLAVQSRQRLRVTLSSGPEICAETNWLSIQKKLQEFCKKRGWCNCKVQYNNGSALEELCDSNSLRRLFELHREALLRDAVELLLYVVPDPTDDTPPSVIDGEEIVLEADQQGSPILLNLRSDVLLGEGGFGQVWRVRDTESQTAYGVKIVKSSLRDGRSQEHMETEISALLKLNHPNIIKVLQHGYILDPVRGRLPAYMMDLGRCSVQDLLETGWHTKAAAEAAQRDMSSALQHFHAAGLGHMDVKPANWLVANKFTGNHGETQLELKLIDAGGAGRLGKDKVTLGIAEYAHPMHHGGAYMYAFFDWYGLHKAIFLLSRAEIDRGLGFRTQMEILQTAGDRLERDKAFVLEAVRQSVFALDCASNILKADKEVVIEAVRRKGDMLKSVWEGFKSDKEVVIEAVRQNGSAIKYASNELKGDKEVVMEAVRQDGSLLLHASQELKGDKEIVLEAVRKYGFALKFASRELQGDTEVVMQAVCQNGLALQYASRELRALGWRHRRFGWRARLKALIMGAVRQDGFDMNLACNTSQSHKKVVMKAVRQNPSALKYAGDKFRNDKEFVMEAVRRNGFAIKYASKELQSDEEVVMEAVREQEAPETREERIARLIAEMQDDWSWGAGEPKAAHDGCIYFAGAPPRRRASTEPLEAPPVPAAPVPPVRSGRAWRAGGSVASSKAAFDEDPDLAALEARLEEGTFLMAKPVRFRPGGCFVRLPGGQEAFLPVEHFSPSTEASTNAVRQAVNKLSRDGKLRVRDIGSDRVSMLKAHEEALRGQELDARRRKMEEGIEKLRENYNPNKVMVGFVSSVQKNGIFVSVIDGLDALIPLKELPSKFLEEDGEVQKPTLAVGQAVQFRIIRYSWQSDGFVATMMPLAARS